MRQLPQKLWICFNIKRTRSSDLNDEHIKIARTLGLKLGAYAVNDEASIRHSFAVGVSVFTTNRPDLALKIRSEYRVGE
jgi:glycerophosphoryl diester phosphodiesterase